LKILVALGMWCVSDDDITRIEAQTTGRKEASSSRRRVKEDKVLSMMQKNKH